LLRVRGTVGRVSVQPGGGGLMIPTNALLNEIALSFREGRVTEREFFHVVERKLAYVARDLWFGWRKKLPSWVELVDVEQELRIQVLKFLPKWQPGRSEKIWDYVIWSSVHRTQRQIHKWRGAPIHGNEGSHPSRAEISFTALYRNDAAYAQGDEARAEAFLQRAGDPYDADQVEDLLDRTRKFQEILQGTRSVQEAYVLRALQASQWSVRRAIIALWEDLGARAECELIAEQDARRVVRRVLGVLARRHGPHFAPCDLWDDERAA
jgi:hypothetical protein